MGAGDFSQNAASAKIFETIVIKIYARKDLHLREGPVPF